MQKSLRSQRILNLLTNYFEMISIDYRTVRKRIPKKYKFNRTVLKAIRKPIKIAQETAQHVRKRVAVRGKPATRPRPYSDSRHREDPNSPNYYVSQAYLDKLGMRDFDPKMGAGRFRSSAEFHREARVQPRTFKVTGGMWSGLTASNEGKDKARFMFERTSLGKGSKKRSLKTDSRTGRKKARKPKKVANSAKAWMVLKYLNVHPLETTPKEDAAMGAAVLSAAHARIEKFFGSGQQAPQGLNYNRKLYRNILRRLKAA